MATSQPPLTKRVSLRTAKRLAAAAAASEAAAAAGEVNRDDGVGLRIDPTGLQSPESTLMNDEIDTAAMEAAALVALTAEENRRSVQNAQQIQLLQQQMRQAAQAQAGSTNPIYLAASQLQHQQHHKTNSLNDSSFSFLNQQPSPLMPTLNQMTSDGQVAPSNNGSSFMDTPIGAGPNGFGQPPPLPSPTGVFAISPSPTANMPGGNGMIHPHQFPNSPFNMISPFSPPQAQPPHSGSSPFTPSGVPAHPYVGFMMYAPSPHIGHMGPYMNPTPHLTPNIPFLSPQQQQLYRNLQGGGALGTLQVPAAPGIFQGATSTSSTTVGLGANPSPLTSDHPHYTAPYRTTRLPILHPWFFENRRAHKTPMDIPPTTPIIDLDDRTSFQRTLREAMKVTLSTICRPLPTDDLNANPEWINSKQYARYLHRSLSRKRKAAVLQSSGRPAGGAAKHKSRQLHAARRVRGKGGRFLTKEERAELAKEEAALAAAGGGGGDQGEEEEDEEDMGSEGEED